ncbi:MAG: family 20 glycosylhydrolase [Bacteroidales bacterium]|nr:family 20 glycosylhydrolase [Bacteroidales bacterium]
MKKSLFLSVLMISFLFPGCMNNGSDAGNLPGPDDLSFSFVLHNNTAGGESVSNVEFKIENLGKNELANSGWTIYFNQFPRTIVPGSLSEELKIDWINGDFHSIKPTEQFSLAAGESKNFPFQYQGWLTKKTFAPMGLYIVYTDAQGEEKGIFPINNYEITFTSDLAKIFPEVENKVQLPNAAWQFKENKDVSLIAKEEVEKIIPTPRKVVKSNGKTNLKEGLMIHFQEGLEYEAEYLGTMLEKTMGNKPSIMQSTHSGPNIIMLSTGLTSSSNSEAYNLISSNEKGVIIQGKEAKGVFYGIQSLISMIPPEAFKTPQSKLEIDAVRISDEPAFNYRGMHIDISRNYIDKQSLMKFIRLMSYYKLNKLQLHLTDDEGWRLEIEELPELTEIGSKRGHTMDDKEQLIPAYGSGPFPDPATSHGSGFLTREDFKELLTFAWQHHIEIIPEINMPGHSRAAIKAMEVRYDRLMEQGESAEAEKYLLSDPEDKSEYYSAQGFTDNVACVCKESVYTFYETVIDDIIEMYIEANVPLSTIHTGGDEVPRGSWEKSPICQDFLEKNPSVGSAKNLHAYFFDRVNEMLEGRKLITAGWEEVGMKAVEGGTWVPNPEFANGSVLLYIWNSLAGFQDLGSRLTNAGYPVILCNVGNFYFDLAYNHHPDEPGHSWGGTMDTPKAYDFIPYDVFKFPIEDGYGRPIQVDSDIEQMERLKPGAKKNILGLQGEIWSETIKGGEMLEYYYVPKLLGFAERAWVGQATWGSIEEDEKRKEAINKDWNTFANSVGQREFLRLDYLFDGFNYRIPPPGAVIKDGMLHVNSSYPGLTNRYTIDGSEPTVNSEVYKTPVSVSGQVKVKAFDSRGHSGRTSTIN